MLSWRNLLGCTYMLACSIMLCTCVFLTVRMPLDW